MKLIVRIGCASYIGSLYNSFRNLRTKFKTGNLHLVSIVEPVICTVARHCLIWSISIIECAIGRNRLYRIRQALITRFRNWKTLQFAEFLSAAILCGVVLVACSKSA